jgi:hypothetical protein
VFPIGHSHHYLVSEGFFVSSFEFNISLLMFSLRVNIVAVNFPEQFIIGEGVDKHKQNRFFKILFNLPIFLHR